MITKLLMSSSVELSKPEGRPDKVADKYDLVFVGGGPATIGFLCYLFQIKSVDKLLSTVSILVVEKESQFGSGCLGKYGINTNTSSEGFARLVCFQDENKGDKSDKLALSPSRQPMKNSKQYSRKKFSQMYQQPAKNTKTIIYRPLPVFANIYQSPTVKALLAIGNRPAPLPLVGCFLDSVGHFLCDYLEKHSTKSTVVTQAMVKQVKVCNNEEFSVTIQLDGSDNCFCVKSKSVILATGGTQKNNLYLDKIYRMKGSAQVFLSDDVLQQTGYTDIVRAISNGKKKVLIIGGSHSGFSCAWILLNRPCHYSKVVCDKCQHDCQCYGLIGDRNWNVSECHSDLDVEVTISYRDHIKVFYPCEQDAAADGYSGYNKKEAVNVHGKVYPFVGIRGDAKELYKKVLSRQETRVQLVKTDTEQDQLELVDQSDIVIWACGYQTNSISVVDSKNSQLDFLCDSNGTFEVDKMLRLINKINNSGVHNLFGIGQGYSTKAPEIINGKKARADSLNLYNTHIAKKLYRSIEPIFHKLLADKNILNSLRRRSEALGNSNNHSYGHNGITQGSYSFKSYKTLTNKHLLLNNKTNNDITNPKQEHAEEEKKKYMKENTLTKVGHSLVTNSLNYNNSHNSHKFVKQSITGTKNSVSSCSFGMTKGHTAPMLPSLVSSSCTNFVSGQVSPKKHSNYANRQDYENMLRHNKSKKVGNF